MTPPEHGAGVGAVRAEVCDCRDRLRAEAEALLVLADSNDRGGHRGNADWCRRAAFGCARAIGVLRRVPGVSTPDRTVDA